MGDPIVRLDLTNRATNSPVIRHPRLRDGRERTSSLDLTSLRLDQLLAAEQAHAQAQPSSSFRSDEDDPDDSPSAHLVPSRAISLTKMSPTQVVRKLSGTSPGQSSRTVQSSSSSHPGHAASSLLSHSPAQSSHSLLQSSSLPILSPSNSSPSHGHGFSRGRSASFGSRGSGVSPSSSASLSVSSFSSFVGSVKYIALLELQRRPVRSALLLSLLLLPLFLVYVEWTGKCHMSTNLAPLLLYTVETFNAHGIAYWLDYGTLLGAVRSGSIIPHEFDLDLSSAIEECERILALKPVFERERGFRMYGRNDWVPEKASFIFGYAGYLHKPCVRIYDPRTLYYVDVDWHTRLSAALLPSSPQPATSTAPANVPTQSPYGTVYLPRAYAPAQGDVWCNEEGFNGNDPGGCRRDADVFPLTTLDMYGAAMKVPAKSSELLRDMYGDSWREPRAKGYKVLVCAWIGGESKGWIWGGIGVIYVGVPLLVWAVSRADRRLAMIIARR